VLFLGSGIMCRLKEKHTDKYNELVVAKCNHQDVLDENARAAGRIKGRQTVPGTWLALLDCLCSWKIWVRDKGSR
jgi:hypothetical protein